MWAAHIIKDTTGLNMGCPDAKTKYKWASTGLAHVPKAQMGPTYFSIVFPVIAHLPTIPIKSQVGPSWAC